MNRNLAVVGIALVTFGVGLFIGRAFPAHHYQRYGDTRYMLDTSSGKMCDAFPAEVKDANGFTVVHPNKVDQEIAENASRSFYPRCDAGK